MTYSTNTSQSKRQAITHAFINNTSIAEFPDVTERLNAYEIIWIRSGKVSLELNLKTYEIGGGTICLLAPGQIRRIRFGEMVQGEYIRLASEYFYSICAEVQFPLIPLDAHHLAKPLTIITKTNGQQELSDIMIKIRNLSGLTEVPEQLLNVWMRLFMLYLKEHIEPCETKDFFSREMQLANEFLALLSKNFATKKMVSDYAQALHVTPNYLNQIVKRVSGFSVSHHIQQFLILEAKRQALRTARSMKQIAYDLGFDDIAHFSKFFKSKAGTNFTDFKKGVMVPQF